MSRKRTHVYNLSTCLSVDQLVADSFNPIGLGHFFRNLYENRETINDTHVKKKNNLMLKTYSNFFFGGGGL